MERRSGDSGRGSSRGSGSSKKSPKKNKGDARPTRRTPNQQEPMPSTSGVSTRASKRKLTHEPAPDTPHPYRGVEQPGNMRVRIGREIQEGPIELLEGDYDSDDSNGGPKLRFRRRTPRAEPPASGQVLPRLSVARRLVFESSPDEADVPIVIAPQIPENRQARRGRRRRPQLRYPQELANLEHGLPDLGIASRLRSRTQSAPRATTRPILRTRTRPGGEQVGQDPVNRHANLRQFRRMIRQRLHAAKARQDPESKRGRGRPRRHR